MSLQECLALKPAKQSLPFISLKKNKQKQNQYGEWECSALVNGFAEYFWVGGIIGLAINDLNASIFALNILTLEMGSTEHKLIWTICVSGYRMNVGKL